MVSPYYKNRLCEKQGAFLLTDCTDCERRRKPSAFFASLNGCSGPFVAAPVFWNLVKGEEVSKSWIANTCRAEEGGDH
jgi:hypothetical protein